MNSQRFSDAGALSGSPLRFIRAGAASDVSDELVIAAVARAKEGDVSALHFLYVRYTDDVTGYVQSIVREVHEAEDITQNVFAKLMEAIGKYEQREVPFKAWILRVARNAALDHIRARRQIPVDEVHGADAGHEQLGFERAQALRAALEGLPHEQREVLVLRHIAGLSPGEIAGRLGRRRGRSTAFTIAGGPRCRTRCAHSNPRR